MRTGDVTRRLNPRHRTTRLGRGVGRAAGFYEQCDDREPVWAAHRVRSGSLVASGRVGQPQRLGPYVLRSLAGTGRLSDFDARNVSITDLLSAVQLRTDAEVIMWHGVDGARIATPVARLFDDLGSELLLGGPDLTARPDWSEPVILSSSSLALDNEMRVVAMTAMTFGEFVGDQR